MPRWPDIAQWVGPTPNTSGSIVDHMYVVVHIADGSYDGTIAWQRNPDANVSSHFIVARDGRTAQMLDTNSKAWTQIEGNPYSISIENEGRTGQSLTDAQVDANARILAKAHQVHGIPLQITNRVGTRGLGHHSMGAESGVNWGHSECPGPAIKAQKPAILARAVAIVNGDDMLKDETIVDPVTEDLVTGEHIQGPQSLTADQRLMWAHHHAYVARKVTEGNYKLLQQLLARPVATVDVTALAPLLAAALAPLLGVDEAAVLAALQSEAGQAALVAAANKAEDS